MENLQVILVLARFFGFNCYHYQETKDGFVATRSRTGICLFLLYTLTYVYCTVENVRIPDVYAYTGADIVDIGGKILLGLGSCDVITVLVLRAYQHQWTAELLNEFRSIDKQLDALGARQTRNFHTSELLVQMVLLSLCTFVAIVFSVYAVERENINYNLPMFVGHLMTGVSIGIIVGVCYAEIYELRLRLIELNAHIRNYLCDENFYQLQPTFGRKMIQITSKTEINYRTDLVARIALIYDELHSVSTKISNRYKFLFPRYCNTNILYGIMAIYTFYRAIFVVGHDKRFSVSIFLVWDLIYKLSLFQSVYNSHLVIAEGKRTASCISYAISQESDKLCIKKLHSFLCQIQHNAIKITTYAFDIHLGAFFVILATNVTYLFILLQFAG